MLHDRANSLRALLMGQLFIDLRADFNPFHILQVGFGEQRFAEIAHKQVRCDHESFNRRLGLNRLAHSPQALDEVSAALLAVFLLLEFSDFFDGCVGKAGNHSVYPISGEDWWWM